MIRIRLLLFYAIDVESLTSKDHFIKIGITRRTIKERYFKTGCGNKYLHKTVIVETNLPLYKAWQQEQQLLLELKEYQYFPNIDFDEKQNALNQNMKYSNGY